MRAHHPDLGGDPAVFIEVLQRLDGAVWVDGHPRRCGSANGGGGALPNHPASVRRQRPKRVV